MRPKVPIPIAAKQPMGAPSANITCPYEALLRHLRHRMAVVPPHLHATSPLFVGPDGVTAVDTDLMHDVVYDIAMVLGMDAKEFNASALRRGGATDLRDRLGSAAGKQLIKQRGRWETDMDEIYSRASVAEHVAASTALSSAHATLTLEQVVPDWVQPARFRR